MLDMGVPLFFIRWIITWLVNRTAVTTIEDECSRVLVFKEGFPQIECGAVAASVLGLEWNGK